MNHTHEPPLSTGTLAKLYGIAAGTVRRWCEDGRLPHTRTLGGHIRVRPTDLAQLLDREQR